MATTFTHLHVHTQYSMLNGAIRIGDLIKKTKNTAWTLLTEQELCLKQAAANKNTA